MKSQDNNTQALTVKAGNYEMSVTAAALDTIGADKGIFCRHNLKYRQAQHHIHQHGKRHSVDLDCRTNHRDTLRAPVHT